MSDTIDYGQLMHRAMRGLMVELLEEISKTGLPGEHHFFITFDTRFEGVELAEWLRDRYPEEITIVMQQWFEDLVIEKDKFSITLNFGNEPERLTVPFDAVTTFVDPSVEFGLRFESEDGDEDDIEEIPESPMLVIEDDDEDGEASKEADVVSLDAFRKT